MEIYDSIINSVIKFLKQRKFGVSGTALDGHTNYSCVFTNLLWYIDPHYNKLKSRNRCNFPEIAVKNLYLNKPSEHGHKAKQINSTDAHIKMNNFLE